VTLTTDGWTLIAKSYRGADAWRRWRYEPDADLATVFRGVNDETVLLMHRRAESEWELVARIAPPAWRHVKRWRDRHPLAVHA
jgi:hypothetical protein